MAIEQQNFNPNKLYLERIGDASNGFKELFFTKAISRVGRAENNEICISNGTTVSREHARIIFKEGRMFIENVSKTNHTFLNDDRVVQRSEVEEGDFIGLGTRPHANIKNPNISENQKFVYLCKRKVEVIEILSSDEETEGNIQNTIARQIPQVCNNDQQVLEIEQNNNVIKKSKIFSKQSSVESDQRFSLRPNIEKIIEQLDSDHRSESESTNKIKLKLVKVVLQKLTDEEVQKLTKRTEFYSNDESSEDNDVTSDCLTGEISSSKTKSIIPTSSTKKILTNSSDKKKKLRRNSAFPNGHMFSRTKSEKLKETERMLKKINDLVDHEDSEIEDIHLQKSEFKKFSLPSQSKSSKLLQNKEQNVVSAMIIKNNKRKLESFPDVSTSSSNKKQRVIANEHDSQKTSSTKVNVKESIQDTSNDKNTKKELFSFPSIHDKFSSEKREKIVKELATERASSSIDLPSTSKTILEVNRRKSCDVRSITKPQIIQPFPMMIKTTVERKKQDSPVRIMKKRRLSMYVSPAPPTVITGEFDMFAKAAMMRNDHMRNYVQKAPVIHESKITTNINAIRKRRMSTACESTHEFSTQNNETPREKSIIQEKSNQIKSSEKPKSCALKVKFTSANRGDYLTQQVIPVRRLSTAQRSNEEQIPTSSNPPISFKEVVSSSAICTSHVSMNEIINANMENVHRKLSTLPNDEKNNEPEKNQVQSVLTNSGAFTNNHLNLNQNIGFYKPVPELTSGIKDYKSPIASLVLNNNGNMISQISQEGFSSNNNVNISDSNSSLTSSNVKSILKANTAERKTKNVKFRDEDKLVSVVEISPTKMNTNNILRRRSVSIDSRTPSTSVATVQPIYSPRTVNQLISNAIDIILSWNAEWLHNFNEDTYSSDRHWSFRSIQNSYDVALSYLETLRRIANFDLIKKMSNAYRMNRNQEFQWLTVIDRKVMPDNRTKLTVKVNNENEHFKIGTLLLLRARNNSLRIPKDTCFLGYITASSVNHEINIDFLTTDEYVAKTMVKAKPLMYIKTEVYSLAALIPLARSNILEKIINPTLNHVELDTSTNSLCTITNLSSEQEIIINTLIKRSYSSNTQKILAIDGGPGTGKSKLMIETILRLHKMSGGEKKFIICSNSNASIDHIAAILFPLSHIRTVRVGNFNKMTPTAFKISLEGQIRNRIGQRQELKYQDVEREIIDGADVVLTTVVSSWRLWEFSKSFDMCFIESADQITDCELIIPAQLKFNTLVLIGYQKHSFNVTNNYWRRYGNKNTPLFMRMIDFFKNQSNKPVFNLKNQFRVPREIFDFCNRRFFNNEMKLATRNNTAAYRILKPYKFFGVDTNDMNVNSSPKSSITMTSVVLEICYQVPKNLQIGILSLSSQQLKDIQNASSFQPQRMDLLSFEASCGIEKDVIIIILMEKDLTIANEMLYILLTRARVAVYIFVDLKIVNYNMWRRELQDFFSKAKRHNHYHLAEPNSDAFSNILVSFVDGHESPDSDEGCSSMQ
ncbi:hypothetical protein PVAND_007725 [Polypedilum vanderplanki]|uniref:FHA domain-containing protein n=1 Tax=Polypedilum vanderplanki TaxID=319348 RepID=A0A9J6C838_POLVA|nr:hypothetical protein PVAND_007725 [Polypedilum vanderplanki]